MTKIMFIQDSIFGGSSNHAQILARKAYEVGFDVSVACYEKETGNIKTNSQVLYFDDVCKGRNFLIKKIKNEKPDIIFSMNTFVYTNDPIFFALKKGIKVVQCVVDYWPICKARLLLRRFPPYADICNLETFHLCYMCENRIPSVRDTLENINMLKEVSAIICLNGIQKNLLINVGIDGDKIHKVPPPIRVPQVIPEYGSGSGVLNVMRVALEKGIYEYIKVANMDSEKKYKWILSGFTNEKMDEKMLGNVIFYENVSETRKNQLYSEAAVFCSTPIWPEPFGLTYFEAKSYGKPVVAWSVGGIREYHRGFEDGSILLRRGDFDGTYWACVRLMEDEKFRKQMGYRARKHAEEFDIDRIWPLYEKILKGI